VLLKPANIVFFGGNTQGMRSRLEAIFKFAVSEFVSCFNPQVKKVK